MTRTTKPIRRYARQDYFIQCFNNGYLLVNHNTHTFRLFGITFIPKNVKRNTKYSFDNAKWEESKISTLNKLLMILTFKYKIVKDSNKSTLAGVK